VGLGGHRHRTTGRGATATDEELLDEAEKHIARYKLPKAFVYRRRSGALACGQGRLPLGEGAALAG
jgi:hypothetical protein